MTATGVRVQSARDSEWTVANCHVKRVPYQNDNFLTLVVD